MARTIGVSLGLMLGLAACGGGGGSDGGDDDPPGSTVTSTVRGRVINTASGAPLSSAAVRSGDRTTTTNANGEFVLSGVPVSQRAPIQVQADGFETSYRIAAVVEGEDAMISVLAVPVGATAMITPGAGGDVTIPGSAALVRFPAGAIEATDPVRVTVTDLNPASAPGNMPGDYTTAGDGQIESFGALTVNLRNAAGAPVSLRAGGTATLRIPLSSLTTSPAPTIPLFFYDEAAGRWVQEGTATLAGSGTGRYYEGSVSHFTTWNADSLYQTVIVTGCVEDRGVPASGVSIQSTGKNYIGTSTARTGADGRFMIPVRPNSLLTLGGNLGTKVASTREVNTSSGALDISSDCLQLVGNTTAFSVRLSWGQEPLDLDAWLQLPQGGEVSFREEGSLTEEPFVNLDTDDTSSFGPEVTTVLRPRVGTYRYFVNNYSETSPPGITASPARVELTANGMLQVFTPPPGETASTFNWTVFDITIAPNCQATVTQPVLRWTDDQPARPQAPDASAPFCSN